MKSFMMIAAVLLMAIGLSACSSTQRGAAAGAIAGGVIGGVTSGTPQGAVAGAAIGTIGGAVAGTLLGRYDRDPTQCVYEDRRGRQFVDDCPEG